MMAEEEEKSKKHIQNSCLTSQNIIILVPNKKYTERSFPFFFFLPHSPCLSVLKDFLCIFFLVYANNLANCALNKTAELFLHILLKLGSMKRGVRSTSNFANPNILQIRYIVYSLVSR